MCEKKTTKTADPVERVVIGEHTLQEVEGRPNKAGAYWLNIRAKGLPTDCSAFYVFVHMCNCHKQFIDGQPEVMKKLNSGAWEVKSYIDLPRL